MSSEAQAPTGNEEEATDGEIAILIDGLRDDVAFHWIVIHLGILSNPPASSNPPSREQIAEAFCSIRKLHRLGLIEVGRVQYIDKGPPGRVAPVEHIAEPMPTIEARVRAACETAKGWDDWSFSCWVVNTVASNAVARLALDRI